MLRELKCVQPKTRLIPMLLEGSSGTPVITEGTLHATVADTAQGVYTVTFTQGFARPPIIVATPVAATGVELSCTLRSVTAASFIVECTIAAGTLTDADIHLLILGFDSPDEV